MSLALRVLQKIRVDSEEVARKIVLEKNFDLAFTESCLMIFSNVSLRGDAHVHIPFVSRQYFDGSEQGCQTMPREWIHCCSEQCPSGDQKL